jgi:hypothetical protein
MFFVILTLFIQHFQIFFIECYYHFTLLINKDSFFPLNINKIEDIFIDINSITANKERSPLS